MGRITGFETERLVDDMAGRVMRGVDATTEAARLHAVHNSHVDTGLWRSNWQTIPARREGLHVIGRLQNLTPYGPYHNFGTSRYPGAHTLEGAVDAEFPTVSRRIVGTR